MLFIFKYNEIKIIKLTKISKFIYILPNFKNNNPTTIEGKQIKKS